MRTVLFALLAAALAGASSCADPRAGAEPGAFRTRGGFGEPVPPGFPGGTFFWREVRGDRDKLDGYRDLRDRALAVLADAARYPGDGGAPSPAAQALETIRETFDETRSPAELEARVAYFDRTEPPAAEGIDLVLVRHATGAPERTLRFTMEDLAQGGVVDGRIDRVKIVWSPDGEAGGPGGRRPPGQLEIELGVENGLIVEHVEVAADTRYRVAAPHLTELFARIQRDAYRPLAGAAFVQLARAAPEPPRLRPGQPQGTSFPVPAPAVH